MLTADKHDLHHPGQTPPQVEKNDFRGNEEGRGGPEHDHLQHTPSRATVVVRWLIRRAHSHPLPHRQNAAYLDSGEPHVTLARAGAEDA